MSDDASLTDFTGGGDDESDVEDAATERDEATRSADAEPSKDSEPIDGSERTEDSEPTETPTYTYTSTPDGAECDACGEVVEERWHAGEGGTDAESDLSPDALVCPDCKEW